MAHYVIDYEASVDRDAEPYNSYLMVDMYDVPDDLAGAALEKFILDRLKSEQPAQFYRNITIR